MIVDYLPCNTTIYPDTVEHFSIYARLSLREDFPRAFDHRMVYCNIKPTKRLMPKFISVYAKHYGHTLHNAGAPVLHVPRKVDELLFVEDKRYITKGYRIHFRLRNYSFEMKRISYTMNRIHHAIKPRKLLTPKYVKAFCWQEGIKCS